MSARKPTAAQDPQALRQKIRDDPYSEQIAQHLGVSLQEYVDQVVHYVLHPKEDPGLYIVKDKDLRAMGLEPPDAQAMGRFVVEAAALAEAADGPTRFVDSRKAPVQLEGSRARPEGEHEPRMDPRLKEELERKRRNSRG
jgi:hypothetical protein